MSEENFSPQQSLALIQNMISKARQDVTDGSKYFLLWGWLTVAVILGQFILKVIVKYPHHYYVWFLLIIGIAINIYWKRADGKKIKVKTYISESMEFLWSGMGVTFLVISLLFIKIGYHYCYPFYILLYGLGTFVTGKILKFKPFIFGGFCAWVLSIAAVQFNFDYQMLFAVAALLISYIIPTYIFRMKNKNQTT
ncbi:MAG TPA: hypothetical protein VFN30_12670 [Chitinophagaceae bacterium]|nr:hypothetical protein [Chitinophagaceae bacterium]